MNISQGNTGTNPMNDGGKIDKHMFLFRFFAHLSVLVVKE